ncbi:hypothetical protein [Ornithinimicrobium kibberense]
MPAPDPTSGGRTARAGVVHDPILDVPPPLGVRTPLRGARPQAALPWSVE